MLRFDFSDFTRENYDVAVYLDEADSTGTERLYTVRAGGTRQQLTRMPEEVRRGFRKELHLPETTTEYVRGRSLTLIFSQKNDSTKLLTVHIPGMMRFSLPLELRDSGAGGEPRYFYSLRPFKLSAVEAGSEEIPLAVRSEGGRRAQLRRFRNRSCVDGRTGRIVAALLRRRRHIREEGIAFRPQAGTIL